MPKDNLYLAEYARPAMMRGVMRCAKAVGQTMGTGGKNSLIETLESPGSMQTNDGFSILNAIRFDNSLEELGRKKLCEATNRANKKSGDGSSTTTVLTHATLEQGEKYIEDVAPMELQRSIENCLPLIEKSLQSHKKEITVDNVSDVATVSAESREIGDLIQEIYQKIGPKGIISWEASKVPEDSYTIGKGIQINGTQIITPYLADMDSVGMFLNAINVKDAPILLCKSKISTAQDLNELVFNLSNKGKKELFIFCEEIDFPAISEFVQLRIQRGFRVGLVKMPILWRDEWWEDLSLATGGKIIDSLSGLTPDKATEEHLGTVDNLRVTKDESFIDGIKDLSEHISKLESSTEDKDLIRAARLNLKTARYYVGAHSESALAYKRLKVEDAINAAHTALESGVVVGGGIALLNASRELPNDTIGGKILKEALLAPLTWIVTNTGKNVKDISKLGGTKGFNSQTGKVEDLMKKGIVDPLDVVLNAVKSAIGVAASILTVGTVVLLSKDDEKM